MPDASQPSSNRASRLQALAAEKKGFDEPVFTIVIDAMLDTMSRNQQRFQTKNAVLAQFRVTLKACRRAGHDDKQRICAWLEKVLEIQNLESSDGMLDNWLNDIPY